MKAARKARTPHPVGGRSASAFSPVKSASLLASKKHPPQPKGPQFVGILEAPWHVVCNISVALVPTSLSGASEVDGHTGVADRVAMPDG